MCLCGRWLGAEHLCVLACILVTVSLCECAPHSWGKGRSWGVWVWRTGVEGLEIGFFRGGDEF